MKNTVYFDNAATTFPKPPTVLYKVRELLSEYCANPGRSSHRLAMRAANEVYTTRERLAKFFGAEEENVVFTSSATHSINLALKSLLKKGDHVLISDIEHNAVLRPVTALAEKGDITFDIYTAYADSEAIITELERKIKPNTVLICSCHHSNICNFVTPVGAVGRFCRGEGIFFLVDASQSAGTLPINVKDDRIDVLCAPSHKGLYGIPGGGFAIFSDRLAKSGRLSTFIEGGNGTSSEIPLMPEFLPERLESGTLPLPAIVSLGAGIDFLNARSPSAILEKEKRLCSVIRHGLSRFGNVTVHSPTDGSILLFSVKDVPSEAVAEALSSHGICVRAGLHCAPLAHRKLKTPESGAVRVSLGAFNSESEARYFLKTADMLF